MYTKYDEQFLIIQDTTEANKQGASEKQMKTDDKITQLTETLNSLTAFMIDQTNDSKSSPTQKDTSTPPDTNTVVPPKKRGPPLEGGHSNKIGGMWTLKHDTSSPKFYEILIKTEHYYGSQELL